jgi:hypothetical protein
MTPGHKSTWLVIVIIIIIIIIIHCSIKYSCFVYLHSVLGKADRTVVIILLNSTLIMEAAYPSETSATQMLHTSNTRIIYQHKFLRHEALSGHRLTRCDAVRDGGHNVSGGTSASIFRAEQIDI